ncbi:MAG TPA: AAA family ATPase [Candidatus Limnocylindria bacterium]|nr:AAA family ATPase [Candidatus Limnocylindria bacterium]
MQSTAGPRLVIVSGAPATGKTTLAEHVSRSLGLPLLAKDELKEAVADQLGAPPDVIESQRLGLAAYAALFAVARRLLQAGVGVIIESNFRRGQSEPELHPLVAVASARLIHCSAEPPTIQERYRDRYLPGARHAAHLDADRAQALREDLAAGLFEPLQLDCPCLVVHTDGDYRPRLDEILRFAAA